MPGDESAHPHRDQLDGLLGRAVAVALLVCGLERLAQPLRRRLDRELERLPAVAQLERRLELGVRDAKCRAALLAQLRHDPRDVPRIELVEQHRSLHVAPARRDDEPERRQHARCRRARDRLDPELVGDRRRVQRTGPAEREQRVAARIDASLDRHHPQRADHLRVGDPDDPLRGLERFQAELAGEAPDGPLGGVTVELEAAGQRGEVAEHHVRIGHCRLGAATPVARGAGLRT